MNVILDYLTSMMSGGIILMTLLGFYGHVEETAAQQAINNSVQEDLTSSTEVMEYDLRKIGYGTTTDPFKVTYADSTKIVFKTDIDNNGSIDSVTYALGTVQTPGSTNPLSRILYRTVNAQKSVGLIYGVTHFRLNYFDASGAPTLTLQAIRSMDVAMNIESPVVIDGQSPGVYWERNITPTNLR